MFSNIAITIRFVLPPPALDELRRRFTAAGVRLDNQSLAGLRQATSNSREEVNEIRATVNITFIHDEADLRQVVPPIPG